ncbi:MAG: UDP-N-acetylmuramate:L-alanyl-gamma-D-glutamyl-meso-diaminopimelate ligase [Rhodothermaceae bacterium]|nr:UDP-N-acetylmuramate:L-alanyl-gamma-D-glutamyl-meso-diaminopimelate ligase [Rhodothermaceae bacterium]
MVDITSLPDAELRIFERPEVPDHIENVYFIAICGTGMGSLAGLFKQAGYTVSGSDEHVYPPMSTRLQEESIVVHKGYDPARLDPAPDLIVVGNACTPRHIEAAFARENGLVQLSFPEALARFFLSKKRSIVVAGTHGKTTTTGILTHLFTSAGKDPSFLVGGVLKERDTSYKVGQGPHFIVEGDEYDTAYFDKRPKFLHYLPTSAIVTSMELDHTDIYADFDTYRSAFESFASLLPEEGTLVLCNDYEEVAALASKTKASVVCYGLQEFSPVDSITYLTAERLSESPQGQRFELFKNGTSLGQFFVPLHGDHNLSNTIGACALSLAEGLSLDEIRRGLATYQGMKRRQEIRGEVGGILVLDDFAHHPTAVKETIRAVRKGYPDKRLVAVFEPRSNTSRRKDFQELYVEAFDSAHQVILSRPPFRHNDRIEDFMDIDELVFAIISRDISASAHETIDQLLAHLVQSTKEGDLVLIMSNGSFGGLHDKFLTELQKRVG